MNEPANYWKLGLFVVVACMLMVAGVVYLGTASLRKETVTYVSYFDESVTGLDIGSPVRFRGVIVGSVSAINIAPDRRHVQISYQLGISVLTELGLAVQQGQKTKLSIPRDLRAQLGSSGVTGVKYILIDFFDVLTNPPPTLPFPATSNYIPAASSTMKNLEDSVMRAIDHLPAIADQVAGILQRVDHVLMEIDERHVPDRALLTLANADETLANWNQLVIVARKTLSGIDSAGLSKETKAAIANLNVTLNRTQGVLARIDGDTGVLASMRRTSDSLGDVAGSARNYGAELSDVLRDLSEVASSIKALADTLELDSDMLLKGRAKVRP